MVYLMDSMHSAAVWVIGTLFILKIAFALPGYVWLLGLLAIPLVAMADLHLAGSIGEPVTNRIWFTGVVIAILFVVDKSRGPLWWPIWLAALALWLLIAVATFRLRKKKAEPVHRWINR